MENLIPILFAAVVGFGHAFEADHILAVSSIVSKRNNIILAIKDGIFWGLGHTSTIVVIGMVIIIGKATFLQGYFSYFEAAVGIMLIVLGLSRLYNYWQENESLVMVDGNKGHKLAYNVGLIHGLAGSGAMVLLVMSEIESSTLSILYLLIFGIGSIVGMLLAAGFLTIPLSKKMYSIKNIRLFFTIASSALCIIYGFKVFIENIS